LEDLRSALKYYAQQGFISSVPHVWMPEKSLRRERILTRSEAAQLLWAAWRLRQTYGKDGKQTERRIGKHLARFILIGLYSGTRHQAMSTAALERMPGRPYFDLDAGLFYRTPRGAKETKKNKNQGVQRVAPSLLAHLRRWKLLGYRFAVEWRGIGPKKVNKGFRNVRAQAGLGPDVVPHILRHTLVTWMLQAGKKTWDVAEYVGMDEETVRRCYGHFSVDHQVETANYTAEARQKRLATSRR
jgi:integrase